MSGGDTIVTMAPGPAPPWLEQALLRLVCRARGHRWQLFGVPMRFGRREWCGCCESNRVLDDRGRVLGVWSAAEVAALDVRLAEALYEARWGDRPRQRMRRGEWPAP